MGQNFSGKSKFDDSLIFSIFGNNVVLFKKSLCVKGVLKIFKIV